MPAKENLKNLHKKIVFKTLLIAFIVLVSALSLIYLGYWYGSEKAVEKVVEEVTKEEMVKEVPYGDEDFDTDEDYQRAMQEITDEGLKPLDKSLKVNGYHLDFTFSYPSAWNVEVDNKEFSTQVVISMGEYKIIIAQGDMGAAACLYPNDPEYNTYLGPHIKLENYVEFEGVEEAFRRSQYPDPGEYLICGKQKGEEGFGSYLISAGFTKYQTPANPSETILREMDRILMSINKV